MQTQITCSHCKYCWKVHGEYTCNNDDSDDYGLETEYDHYCPEAEER